MDLTRGYRSQVKILPKLSICLIATILFQTFNIEPSQAEKSHASCTAKLINSTQSLSFDGRQVLVSDPEVLDQHCKDLVFDQVFPSSECVLNVYPGISSGNLPTHPELFREFAAVTLGRMASSNVYPFIVDPTLLKILAPVSTYQELAVALLKLRLERVDAGCNGNMHMPRTISSTFRGYLFVKELRGILDNIQNKILFFPRQLSPLGLLSHSETRSWAEQLIGDHNIQVLALLSLKNTELIEEGSGVFAPEPTPDAKVDSSTSNQNSEPGNGTGSQQKPKVVTTLPPTTLKPITTTIQLSTTYNESIQAEINKYRPTAIDGLTDQQIVDNLHILRKIRIEDLVKPSSSRGSSQTDNFRKNPIFRTTYQREIDSNSPDGEEAEKQDLKEGFRELTAEVDSLKLTLSEVDKSHSESVLRLNKRVSIIENFKTNVARDIRSINSHINEANLNSERASECCENHKDEHETFNSNASRLESWYKAIWGLSCCSLGLLLSSISLGLTVSTWIIFIFIKCCTGKCDGFNQILGSCCRCVVAACVCCVCRGDYTICGHRCYEGCYEGVPASEHGNSQGEPSKNRQRTFALQNMEQGVMRPVSNIPATIDEISSVPPRASAPGPALPLWDTLSHKK